VGTFERYTDRVSSQTFGPLVRWDGARVVLNLMMVEEHLRHLIRPSSQLEELRLYGLGDAVRIDVTVVWKGLKARLGLELGEIRLRRRRLGLRLRRVHALGAVRVPRRAVEALLARLFPDRMTVISGQGIVVIDLSPWVPPELTLSILTVQATERSIHLWLGPGDLRDLPVAEPPALPADVEVVQEAEKAGPSP
jgi:hypothetical protein